jgi:hypothetical protein
MGRTEAEGAGEAEAVRDLAVHLTLFGHPHTGVALRVEVHPVWRRRVRAVGTLLVCWGAMPILFFIPPHAEWLVAAFFGGLYLAHREWTTEYRVVSFAGACPRCGSDLELRPGSRLRLPDRLGCGACRRESLLEPGWAPAAEGSGRVTGYAASAEPPADVDAAALAEYWRARRRRSVWSPASSEYGAADPWRQKGR